LPYYPLPGLTKRGREREKDVLMYQPEIIEHPQEEQNDHQY
jgi:hypothetical protein